MAPAGRLEARKRSASTCDWRHSAKRRTAATRATCIGRSSTTAPALAKDGVRDVSRRHSDGTCTATIRQPPAATPTAAERTPQPSPRRNIAAMMPVL